MKQFYLPQLLLLVLLLGGALIGRSQTLTPDESFNLRLNSNLSCILSESDGSYILGGGFLGYGASDERACLAHVDSKWSLIDDLGGMDEPLFTSSEDIVFNIERYPNNQGQYLLVAGTFAKYRNQEVPAPLIRINLQGKMDPNFNPVGITGGYIYNVHALSDGKVLVTGDFEQVAGSTRYGVARLNADGTLDETFNKDGVGFTSKARVLRSIVQPDGKIILAGSFNYYNGTKAYRLLRLLPDGSIDPTFELIGKSFDWIRDAIVDSQGRILVAGDFGAIDGHQSPFVARFNPNGGVDKTFTSGLSYDPDADYESGAWCISSYKDKYLVGLSASISSTQGSALIALETDGSINKGLLTGVQPEKDVTCISPLADGSIIISGSFKNYPVSNNSYNARLIGQVADFNAQGYKVILDEDFEQISIPSTEETIVSIDGHRWRVRNASIESDPIMGVLNGKQSLRLIAKYDEAAPEQGACLELLDPINQKVEGLPDGFFIRARMRGQEGLLSTSGWYLAFTLDDGVNWMEQDFKSLDEGGIYNNTFPIAPEHKEGASMRIKIYYKGSNKVQGQSLLIDDLILYNGEDYGGGKPTVFSVLNMYDGYRTNQTDIPVLLDLNFGRGLWDPNVEPPSSMFDSHIAIKLDDKPYKELYKLPVPSPEDPITEHFRLQGLSSGTHKVEVQLIKNKDRQPWGPYSENFIFHIEAGVPLVECAGISEALTKPKGTIITLRPKSTQLQDSLRVNMYAPYRNRHYIFDASGALLVDDPFGYWPVTVEYPEHIEYAVELTGEIIEMNGTKMLRLNQKPIIDTPKRSPYKILALPVTLKEYLNDPSKYENALFLLKDVHLADKDQEQPINRGGVYTLYDNDGNKVPLFIQLMKKLGDGSFHTLPKGAVDILALGSRSFLTGEHAIVPIMWKQSSANRLVSNTTSTLKAQLDGCMLHIQTPSQANLKLYNLDGVCLTAMVCQDQMTIALDQELSSHLVHGSTLIVLLETETEYYTAKLVLP